MSSLEETLSTGEKIVYQTKLHWFVYLVPAGMGLAGFVVFIMGLLLFRTSDGDFFYIVPAIMLLLMAGLVFLITFLKRKFTLFAVTNKRVVMKKGILNVQTVEIQLSKIETVAVNKTIWTSNYGTIVLRGSGGSTDLLPMVDKPFDFKKAIQEQMDKL